MALEKAYIQPLGGRRKGKKIKVLFNPSEYSIEKGNQFQSTALPGTATPITQFVSGNAQTLTMNLFFDSYEKGEDVRKYTRKLTSLMDIDSELHAPPVCEFVWGLLQFKGMIERISQNFTIFLDSGIPVRATLNITFKEYKTLTEQLGSPPKASADRTKRQTVKQDDKLWLIASQQYEDPSQWRAIATANQIDNPRLLNIGQELVIPPLE